MLNSKKTRIGIVIALLVVCMIGTVLEYARMKKTYRQYITYETQMETGLLARLAQDCLENGKQRDFEQLCMESPRYRPVGHTVSKNKEKQTILPLFAPPVNVGVQSRVTLFDHLGKVIFDSWVDADKLENHANRPEFQLIMNEPKESCPYIVFERYSTTLQTKMFFCIVKFEVKNNIYLLRVGNTVNAVQLAGNRDGQTLFIIIVLAIVSMGLIVFFFVVSLSSYRKKLLDIQWQYSDSNGENDSTSESKGWTTLDHVISNIQGEMTYRSDLLSRERQIRDIIFQSLTEGVVLLDDNGQVLDINDGACQLLEIDGKNIKGRSFFGVWRNLELEQMFQEKEWKTSMPKKELAMDLPYGKRTIDVRLRSIQLDKISSGCLLLLYDLTRIQRLESFRRDFVTNVSHEIKTPLTVIMGSVEALQDGAIHETKLADQFLRTIVLHSKRLYALVQDVLSLSNLESNPVPEKDRFKEVSLYDSLCLATSYCEEAARKKFITISVKQPKDDDNALVIPEMLEQAFINLIDNGIKYSGATESEPKKITITISCTTQNSLEINFIDEGPGIPAVHQDRVFERFYRVDPSRSKESGGTGLGLAIVKHIVQIHRGSVSVKNNPDRGCTFTIYLPKCR